MKKIATMGLIGLMAVSCGGDGGSGESAPVPVSSKLIDSAVVGLSYETSGGTTGVTGAGGSFNCMSNETIIFKLNNFVLASGVPCSEFVTPYTMASTADEHASLAVLLQNMDADGDATNGISIDSAKANNVTADIDLSNTAAVDQIATDTGTGISRTDANTHLETYGKNAGRYVGSFTIVNNGSDGGAWCDPLPVSIGFDGDAFTPVVDGVTYPSHNGFGAAAFTDAGTVRTQTATYTAQSVTGINAWTPRESGGFGGAGNHPLYFANPSPEADDISECNSGEYHMSGVRLTDIVITNGTVTGKFAAVVMCDVGGDGTGTGTLTEYEWCNGTIDITK